MRYARETLELLAAYPGRPFRMAGIVNYVCGKSAERRRKKRVTEGVRRVLQALEAAGSIVVKRAERSGESSTYTWVVSKAPHETIAEHH